MANFNGTSAPETAQPDENDASSRENLLHKNIITMIGQTISHYKIIEKLGSGGMGVVYQAEDTKLKRLVAIKFLPRQIAASEEERERFKIEAQAAAALNHPNIATIHAIEEVDDEMFIVMEYIEGRELKQLLIDNCQLTIDNCLFCAMQIAEGLKAAHAKGITHRDIKSSNIMVTESGQVKIMDFGLAKIGGGVHLTKSGTTLGTAAYMSPEQARGNPVDHRTDAWSFGVVLFEMLTGRLPFRGEYEQAMMYSIVNEEPDPVSQLRADVPPELEAFIYKALAKDANERYQHVDEMLMDLKTTQKAQESGSPSPTKARSRSRKKVRSVLAQKLPFLIGGVVVLAVLVAAVFLMLKTTESDTTGKKSIAVLPFENLSGKQEEEYLSDGITEDVLAQISKIADLRVMSRATSRQYKDTKKNPQEIGAELQVANLLMGTVRRSGDELRIGCELIEAATGSQLWANTFNRKVENVFAIQSEVALEIAQILNARLSEKEVEAIEQRPTANMEAYDYYLQGNNHRARWDHKDETELAIKMYEKAIELDSSFAIAYAALARARIWLRWNWYQEEQVPKAKEAVDKALLLAPDAPETNVALGSYFYYGCWDYENALKHYTIAQRQRPRDPEIIMNIANIRSRQGRWEEAIAGKEKAMDLDPRNYGVIADLAETYARVRRFEQAERLFDRALSLALPSHYMIQFGSSLHIRRNGDIQKARQTLQEGAIVLDPKWLKGLYAFDAFQTGTFTLDLYERHYEPTLSEVIDPDKLGYYLRKAWVNYFMRRTTQAKAYADSLRQLVLTWDFVNPDFSYVLPLSYAFQGGKEDAMREGKKALERLPISKDAYSGADLMLNITKVYVVAGEHEKAIDHLGYLLSVPSAVTVPLLKIDPVWDPLREHPRFKKLIKD